MSVIVLMSTYNGEKYLKTQLDSILSQTYKDIKLFVRDDGSNDATCSILEAYAAAYPHIRWYAGCNIGACQSFFELINTVEPNYDYYAFADQDDVWLPDKISRAVIKLKASSEKKPMLYCSDKIITNENLDSIKVTVSCVFKQAEFGNALVQNMCTGCTAVINKELLELLQHKTPVYAIMHDWWLYLVATCFGKVYYARKSYIKYRQHGNNASGAIVSKRLLMRYRLKQLSRPRGAIYRQAEEFINIYTNPDISNKGVCLKIIPEKNVFLLHKLLKSKKSIVYRFKVILDKRIFRQKISDNIVFHITVLVGKL